MQYLLGLDTSTTATKALIIDEAGRVVTVAAAEYPYETPRPGWTEQSAELFWRATVQSIRAALAQAGLTGRDIAGVGLTGQMHGLVTLDTHGKLVRPADSLTDFMKRQKRLPGQRPNASRATNAP
jgi:xylulokinase